MDEKSVGPTKNRGARQEGEVKDFFVLKQKEQGTEGQLIGPSANF